VLWPRLSRAEWQVLETVWQMYETDADWPHIGDLHRRLARELEGDLEEVVSSLLGKLGAKPGPREWSDQVRIPPRGILLNPRIEETYALLMRAMPLLSEYYLSSTDKPRVNHEYFLARGWSKSDVARLYDLMRYQAFQGGGGSTPEAGTWTMDLTPAIVRYSKAKSARELWTRRLQDDRRWARQLKQRGHRGRTGLSAAAGDRSWIDRFLLPLVLGVAGAVIAGAILWRLGLG
jgi:hypothetical protein